MAHRDYGDETEVVDIGYGRYEFPTGATRNSNEGKLEYARFFSPRVLRRRAEYMRKHGIDRDPDNWKKGITLRSYIDSLSRHFVESWELYDRGHFESELEDSLCAVMFNAEGMLYELLKDK